MSFGSMNVATPTPKTLAAVSYFVTVNELTMHNTPNAREETAVQSPAPNIPGLEQFIPYSPFVISAILFLAVFVFMVMSKIRSVGNIITALLLAVLAGGIPTILTYVQQGSRQSVNAGPEEIPRNVQVQKISPDTARITWHTDAARIGVVKLSPSPFADASAMVFVADNRKDVQTHTVDISGLKNQKSYEFEILSGHTWYDNGGKYVQFVFLSTPPGQ